ncbi:hypothetical protein IA57_05855 [Mangrovimonas yunxiaonensis]|uniref:IPExxxVDY family protein n=1 Tax=Mangrovimonas yunxiaonensis TaxID=1197477 RepID=A0A084TKW4_9FLAO|nr:IPExxxVDY family protein [Mangrovimonas yunxiaonensis]KFB01350.1 hypothetical protein IA57_05855 [Mangrovimonas yunxiaonensis]MBR9757534.1 IPExxxVDY family protein [Algicola sp.]GGH37215.1 hypothetical protein GCM10011364_05020 [Mangrovimonas yunxiaonensis]
MGIYKLNLDCFDEIDYKLIGIHTSIEDYRLAYLLNKTLNLNLKREKDDLEFGDGSKYAIFTWLDEASQITWNLAANVCKQEMASQHQENNSLFSESDNKTVLRTSYLLPEHKKVNYLLKIEDEGMPPQMGQKLAVRLQEMPHVIAAYEINTERLKSKNNLIFY